LSGIDGINVCRHLRNKKIDTPILILSCKQDTDDIINGLDSGADDYLTKPFQIGILSSRLRSIIRRARKSASPIIEVRNIIMDTLRKQIWKDNIEIPLTLTEYEILEYLFSNPDKIISRNDFEQHIWNLNNDHSSNIIDVYIKNLRLKLGDNKCELIVTRRGRGYQII